MFPEIRYLNTEKNTNVCCTIVQNSINTLRETIKKQTDTNILTLDDKQQKALLEVLLFAEEHVY